MKRYRPFIGDALTDTFIAFVLGWQAWDRANRADWSMTLVFSLVFLASIALTCTRRITDAMHHYRTTNDAERKP